MKKFWLVSGWLLAAGATGFAAELFVAPEGSDANSGAAGSPFATLEKARDAARALHAAQPAEPVTVQVRGGTYPLPHALKLGAQDSATTWRAYRNENCLLYTSPSPRD